MKKLLPALTAAIGILAALISHVGKCAAQANPQNEPPVPIQWRDDAALRDVFFLNHDLGWAVGDQGAVWRTTDGGRSWILAPTNVDCSLRSVRFVDERNGWAAGGQAVPLIGRTRAVLLRTSDGGRTWQPIEGTMLPAIERLVMTDANHGWAWGAPTRNFPNGIVVTPDGGRSWMDFPQETPRRWTAVCRGQRDFVAANDRGELGTYREGRFHPALIPDLKQTITELTMFDEREGWAIGQRQILATEDGGQSWQALPMPAEADEPSRFQFLTAASAGSRRWLAGSPGSYVFSYDRTNRQWSRSRTPVRSAIHKLFMLDEHHGWAVGDLGLILATRDGGDTWQVQRNASDRLGLLLICRSPESIPFDVLARYSGDQGFRTGVVLCQADSVLEDGPRRAFEACQRQGVCTFTIVDWASPPELQQRFVGLIRQLQPTTVVVADHLQRTKILTPSAERSTSPTPAEQTGLDAIVAAAVASAADPNQDRAWINHAALAPWQTPFTLRARKKVISGHWGGADYLPALGQNLFDQILISRALWAPKISASEGFELVGWADRRANASDDPFGGLTKGPLAPPRRKEIALRGFVGQLKSINNKASTLDQLADHFDSSPASLRVWRQRIDALIAELPSQVAGDWLWQLSEVYARNNQMELAAFARAALLERVADHPLSSESRLWLAAYYASSELAWCEFLQKRKIAENHADIMTDRAVQKAGLRAVPQKTVVDGVTQWVWVPETPEEQQNSTDPRADVVTTWSEDSSTDFAKFTAERLKLAQSLTRSIQETDAELSLDPLQAFAASLLKAKTEDPVVAETEIRRLRTQSLPQPHRQAIARELQLLGAKSWNRRRDVIECQPVAAKPFLDGVLDDEAWQIVAKSGKVVRLSSAPTEKDNAAGSHAETAPNATELMLARDNEYLYVAVVCPLHGSATERPNGTPVKRQRDQFLDQSDMLQIALDIDRDGRSYYLFSIDHSGSFADQIGENRPWNPTWFLAHARSDSQWTVEAAIRLDQLAPPLAQNATAVWGLSVRRHLAGGAVERWSPTFESPAHENLASGLTMPEFLPHDGLVWLR